MKTSDESNHGMKFVHRFIPGTQRDAARPLTLLLLHGTGGDENDLVPLGRELIESAGLSANILSPRGRVEENGMPRFFRRFAEGVFDEADLKFRAAELADFIGDAAAHYEFDAASVVAVGYSNGANIAAGMMLLRPHVLMAAALLHPMMPFTPNEIPDLKAVAVLVSSGRFDPIARPDEAERLVALLTEAKALVTHRWQSSEHNLTVSEVSDVSNWLTELGMNVERT